MELSKSCLNCKFFCVDDIEEPCANCKNTAIIFSDEWFNKPFLWEDKDDCVSVPAGHDPVNHPSHYCREDAMESIDEMVAVFGKDAVMGFCICNVWKYRYRAGDKNGQEDLKKSDWYMKKYIELKGEV